MRFDRALLHQKIYFYTLLLVSFSLPVYPRLSGPLLIVLFINWLAEADFKNKWNTLIRHQPALLMISLYGMHMVGMLYTDNYTFGLFDLQVKLPLLILPLIFATAQHLGNLNIENILRSFVYGNFAALLLDGIHASYQTIFYDKLYYFFYKDLSLFMHPGYFAIYIVFAMIILAYETYKKWETLSVGYKVLNLVMLVLFAFFIVLLTTKAPLLALIIIVLYCAGIFIFKKKKYLLAIGALLFLLLMIWIAFSLPDTGARLKQGYQDIKIAEKTTNSSTAIRIQIWQSAFNIFRQHPLTGVGTGDVKDELLKAYEKDGIVYALESRLNAHNQYLQTAVALGCIGLVTLLTNMLLPFLLGVKYRNYLLVFFQLLFMFCLLTESCFEVQSGVMYYAFFNSLLYFSYKQQANY